jgi:Mg2+ and Co2+ transporter CorA
MEYLSKLAVVFLPLTLFASLFGMNIQELGDTAPRPSWDLYLYVAIPSTFVTIAMYYISKKFWKRSKDWVRHLLQHVSRKFWDELLRTLLG